MAYYDYEWTNSCFFLVDCFDRSESSSSHLVPSGYSSLSWRPFAFVTFFSGAVEVPLECPLVVVVVVLLQPLDAILSTLF